MVRDIWPRMTRSWTAHRGRISGPYTRITVRTSEISPETRRGISLHVVRGTSGARIVSFAAASVFVLGIPATEITLSTGHTQQVTVGLVTDLRVVPTIGAS